MDQYHIPEERALSTDEYALLEWLINIGGLRTAAYASQLPRTTVVSRCYCGCPSIDLAVDGRHTSGVSDVIANVEGASPEGFPVGVILHCREGQLSELEVYCEDDTNKPFLLPRPSDLSIPPLP